MTATAKFVVLGLSLAVLACVLFAMVPPWQNITPSGKSRTTSDGSKSTTKCGYQSKSEANSENDFEASTKKEPLVPSTARVTSPGTLTATPSSPSTVQKETPPPPAPYTILYLLQTEQCIPSYFQLTDVFGNPNPGYDVMVLSFKEPCLDTSMSHVYYLLNTSTTWTTGRNLLFEAAMKRNKTYLYYVFMDDDFALGDPRQLPIGPWRRFENSLRAYEPAVAAIDSGWVQTIRDFHVSRQCSGEAAEFVGTVWYDAICNAFHYKAIRHILPYDPTYDEQTWWASQMAVIIRSEVLFRGQVTIHTELFGQNSQHRPYPRDMNFSPQMIDHMTEGLEKLVPEFRLRCANLIVQQWRTTDVLVHGATSSTLCLPPMPYHDNIVHGRYTCG